MKLEFSRHILEKSLNNKCHECPSGGSAARTERLTDGRVNVMELMVAFRRFVNAHINWYLLGKYMILVS